MEPSTIAVSIVAVLHAVFFILESLMWTTPHVRRIFRTTANEAETTKVLALNQGFYNLGSAVMLACFLVMGNTIGMMGVLLFLSAMGIVGAITANWQIILVQTLPAIVVFLLLFF